MEYTDLRTLLPYDIMIQIFRKTDNYTKKVLASTCKYFNLVSKDPFIASLTEKQRIIISRCLEVVPSVHSGVGAGNTVTCGTGTGKTLIAMFVIKKWVEQGHRVLILLELPQMQVWRDEWDKWRKMYDLPEFTIYHQSNIKVKSKATEEEIRDAYSLPSSPVIAISKRIPTGYVDTPSGRIFSNLMRNRTQFTRYFADEASSLGSIYWDLTRYIINGMFRQTIPHVILNLNATKGIRGIGWDIGEDEDLPGRPRGYIKSKTFDRNFGREINLDWECTDTTNIKNSVKSLTKDINGDHSTRILVCHNINEDVFRDQILSIWKVKGKVEIIKTSMSLGKKQKIMDWFKEGGDEKKILVSRDTFACKGHNIFPQSLYYLIGDRPMYKILSQLYGRVWRHGSRWKKVKIINYNYDPSSINPYILTYVSQLPDKERRVSSVVILMSRGVIDRGLIGERFNGFRDFVADHLEELSRECKFSLKSSY